MIDWINIVTVWRPVLAKTSALDRLAAVRNTPSWHHGWQWMIIATLVVLVAIIIVSVVVAQLRKRLADMAVFAPGKDAPDKKMFLTGSEIELLTRLIQQSGLTRDEPKFTLQHAFNVGMANYFNSDFYCEQPEDHRQETASMIDGLRAKLGVERQEYSEESMNTGVIPLGAQITVVHKGLRDDFGVVLQKNTREGLLVQSVTPVEFRPGDSWLMRYFDGVQVWEFTSRVTHEIGGCLLVEHADEMEVINIRRFVRVPVRQAAKVSRFGFHSAGPDQESLNFLHADVIEIGGPGLLIKTSLDVRVGDRILVLLDLGQREAIQGVGKIRRRNDPDPVTGQNRYGVELVDLKPAQVAELMQVTNTAAIQLRKEAQEKSEQEREPVSAGAMA